MGYITTLTMCGINSKLEVIVPSMAIGKHGGASVNGSVCWDREAAVNCVGWMLEHSSSKDFIPTNRLLVVAMHDNMKEDIKNYPNCPLVMFKVALNKS